MAIYLRDAMVIEILFDDIKIGDFLEAEADLDQVVVTPMARGFPHNLDCALGGNSESVREGITFNWLSLTCPVLHCAKSKT